VFTFLAEIHLCKRIASHTFRYGPIGSDPGRYAYPRKASGAIKAAPTLVERAQNEVQPSRGDMCRSPTLPNPARLPVWSREEFRSRPAAQSARRIAVRLRLKLR
jgi:hypothetical protein